MEKFEFPGNWNLACAAVKHRVNQTTVFPSPYFYATMLYIKFSTNEGTYLDVQAF